MFYIDLLLMTTNYVFRVGTFLICILFTTGRCIKLSRISRYYVAYNDIYYVIICPIAIAYSMGQIIKSVCVCRSVCLSVCVSVRLRALSRSHFLTDFHKNWHRRKNPEK